MRQLHIILSAAFLVGCTVTPATQSDKIMLDARGGLFLQRHEIDRYTCLAPAVMDCTYQTRTSAHCQCIRP